MNDIARQTLEDLLALLPTAIDRERIAQEFGRTATDPALHADPKTHAGAVVQALLNHRAQLRDVLQFLAAQHPSVRDRTDQVALLLLPVAEDDEEDEPTEMIDPALLASLRGSAPSSPHSRTSPAETGLSSRAAAPTLRAPSAATAPSGRTRPPRLPRGGGGVPAAPRRRLSSAALAAGVLVLLVAAAALGLAALQ